MRVVSGLGDRLARTGPDGVPRAICQALPLPYAAVLTVVRGRYNGAAVAGGAAGDGPARHRPDPAAAAVAEADRRRP
ncbi:hypothetical protein GCM10010145_60000 [Streptomyces ruber]|uniref:Uncharacterized protein n=2 Tax=Streptomyces TaxID=1883 RepID=A0A918BPR8_9ACTN|nr:hypothetical protein GCM10010145_60000 [Streptomyces ruber]